MSGFEVIGLISAIIGIVDYSTKLYSACRDKSKLPQAFREAAQRLSLVQETLQTVKSQLSEEQSRERQTQEDEDAWERAKAAIKSTLQACRDKVDKLDELFKEVIPTRDASRYERYWKVAKAVGRASEVELLMKIILENVQLLAGNQIFKVASTAQVEELKKALTEIEILPPSVPKSKAALASMGIYNYGSEPQYVHTGSGDQNNNTGRGNQFSGTFNGSFNMGAETGGIYAAERH